MKMVVLLAVAIAGWFVYFQFIDWLLMKAQALDYFAFLNV